LALAISESLPATKTEGFNQVIQSKWHSITAKNDYFSNFAQNGK
jgi:hypothetical protein